MAVLETLSLRRCCNACVACVSGDRHLSLFELLFDWLVLLFESGAILRNGIFGLSVVRVSAVRVKISTGAYEPEAPIKSALGGLLYFMSICVKIQVKICFGA